MTSSIAIDRQKTCAWKAEFTTNITLSNDYDVAFNVFNIKSYD